MKIKAKIDRMVNAGNVKAIASVSLDGMFVVKNLKVMDGRKGLFVSMPQETYCDMHGHTTTGVFESTPEAEYFPYIMPQEHGNHTGCKWLKLENGLCFDTRQTFEINVSQFSTESLTLARHASELKSDGCTHVRIDYKDSGLGSNSCGPELLEKYRLSEKNIEFSFTIYVG